MSEPTIDRLVRLLDASERRAEVLQNTIRQMQIAAEEKPYAPADSDAMARELAHVANRSKINAIKLHRQFCRSPLKDSKDAVERYWPLPELPIVAACNETTEISQ